MSFNALGFDPGFAKLGWSVVHFDDVGYATFKAFNVICTEKTKQKKTTRVADDNYERTQIIAHELSWLMSKYQPNLLCAE